MITITRKLEFDSGHRVLGHSGKCQHLHGHRYVAEITVASLAGLDKLGFVVDFSVVKTVVGGWIDEYLDHNILLHDGDPLLDFSPTSTIWGGKKPYIMPSGQNPTAENLAALIGSKAAELLRSHDLVVVSVRVWETPNCFADWRA